MPISSKSHGFDLNYCQFGLAKVPLHLNFRTKNADIVLWPSNLNSLKFDKFWPTLSLQKRVVKSQKQYFSRILNHSQPTPPSILLECLVIGMKSVLQSKRNLLHPFFLMSSSHKHTILAKNSEFSGKILSDYIPVKGAKHGL